MLGREKESKLLYYYSIFDKKTGGFGTPHPHKHVQEALRAVQGLLESGKGGDYARYAGDFALYHLGTFDQTTGHFMKPAEGGPSFVMELAQLMPVTAPEQKGVSNA